MPASASAACRRRAFAHAYSLPRTARRWRTSSSCRTSAARSSSKNRAAVKPYTPIVAARPAGPLALALVERALAPAVAESAPGGESPRSPELASTAPQYIAAPLALQRPAMERELVELIFRQPVPAAQVAAACVQMTQKLDQPGTALRAVGQLPLDRGPRTVACYLNSSRARTV